MLTLGIVAKETAHFHQLKQQIQSQTYDVIRVEQKKQVNRLDGLLLIMEENEEFGQVIEWLFECQKRPSMFVWVFSTSTFEYEEDVLLGLGANAVVMTIEKETTMVELIKNTLCRVTYLKKAPPQYFAGQLMNQRNQSMLLDGMEILLTRNEYKVLSLLYDNKNNVVSYTELLRKVWPNKGENETYRLTNIIFHLRKKINNNNQVAIKTVSSKGYVLMIKKT